MPDWTVDELARMIDHSLLHPMLDDEQLIKGMAVAVERNCASVCIKPYFVGIAAKLLDGTGIRTGTVVGFPHGSGTVQLKIDEAKQAVDDGADEIDMVVNIGKVRSGEWGYLRDEIGGVNACVTAGGAILKVIFENDFLCDAMIEQFTTMTFTGLTSDEGGMTWDASGAVSKSPKGMVIQNGAYVGLD